MLRFTLAGHLPVSISGRSALSQLLFIGYAITIAAASQQSPAGRVMSTQSTRRSRPAALWSGVIALLLCVLALRAFLGSETTQNALALYILQLEPALWALLIAAAALGAGSALLRLLRVLPAEPLPAALFGVGTGLGLISALALLFGKLGWSGRLVMTCLLVLLVIVGAGALQTCLAALLSACRRRHRPILHVLLLIVLGLFLLMNLTRAWAPPVDYDSLEYHVAAPAAYVMDGRVHFLEHNVYASFPQNVEMWHYLGMRLTGDIDRGVTVGQLLSALTGFLAALAVYAALRKLADRTTGLLGASAFYTWAGVTYYSGMPYVELPLIFYGILAILALVRGLTAKGRSAESSGWVVLAGMAAGFGMGVKYTAALLIFIPILAWIGIAGRRRRERAADLARRAAVFVAVAVVCFSPWLIRNAVNTGNPVYPLLYGVLDGRHWSAEQNACWTHEHSAHEFGAASFLREAQDVLFFAEEKASMLLVVFIPACLLLRRKRQRAALGLALTWAGLFLLYYIFTQRNSRFLDVGVPILALLSGLGVRAVLRYPGRNALAAVFVVLLLLGPSRLRSYRLAEWSLGQALGEPPAKFFEEASDGPFGPWANMQQINDVERFPPPMRVLFLGEARAFYCRRPHVAPTVFNTHPLEQVVNAAESAEAIREGLKRRGITHLYVNTAELMRLQETYRYPHEGAGRLGMLDGFNWPLFDAFARRYLRVVEPFQGPAPEAFPWANWNAFRESRWQNPEAGGHFVALYAIE